MSYVFDEFKTFPAEVVLSYIQNLSDPVYLRTDDIFIAQEAFVKADQARLTNPSEARELYLTASKHFIDAKKNTDDPQVSNHSYL
jgi:hypothetical protein